MLIMDFYNLKAKILIFIFWVSYFPIVIEILFWYILINCLLTSVIVIYIDIA